MAKTITIEVSDTVYSLLEVLGQGDAVDRRGSERRISVENVVSKLIDHAQQGVYRPGAWERQWLEMAFSDDWQKFLEPGDPYGRAGDGFMFCRPVRGTKQ